MTTAANHKQKLTTLATEAGRPTADSASPNRKKRKLAAPTADGADRQQLADKDISPAAGANPVTIELNSIDPALQPASQMRVRLDEEAIAAYAACLDSLPPIKLFHDPETKTYWVADGAHTIKAHQSRGKTSVPATVQQGSYQDAFAAAARANLTHGMRITNADKQHRVRIAFKTWPDAANRLLAELCGVDEKMIRTLRKSVPTAARPQLTGQKTVGRDGKHRKPPTSKGKHKQPESQPDGDTVQITQNLLHAHVTDSTHITHNPLPVCDGVTTVEPNQPDGGVTTTPMSDQPVPDGYGERSSIPYEALVVTVAQTAVNGEAPSTWDSRWERVKAIHFALYQEWPAEKRPAYLQNCLNLYLALQSGGGDGSYWVDPDPIAAAPHQGGAAD